jgi:1,4-dihydroxy-2-naphthoyl-CoA hydrolase
MAIWKQSIDLDRLNAANANTLVERLGMRITAIGEDHLSGTMPVDTRTLQPFGLLHGGASVALAETLGSVAANLTLESDREVAVGLDINANHIRSATSGQVFGTARPLHLGRTTQVWEIRIVDADDRLICISRLTLSIVPRRPPKAG